MNHTYTITRPVTVQAINSRIRYMGIKLVAGKGYYYFLRIATGDQVGASVMIYRAAQQSLDAWIADAERAIEQQRKRDAGIHDPSL